MTKPNSSAIIVVLDRSGSMATIRDDMVGGFQTFMAEQKIVPGACEVSLFQFDDVFEPVYVGRPIRETPNLTLIPRGNTALHDAVGKTMVVMGERFAKMPEWERPSKVIFVLITDGQENASREYSKQRIHEMIAHQETHYAWSFVYLGSSPSTMQDAKDLGIAQASNYIPSSRGVARMNYVLSNAVASYRSDNSVGAVLQVPQDIGEEDEQNPPKPMSTVWTSSNPPR